MEKRIAIVSLRFAPGHIAHLKAYYEMFLSVGCDARLFLDSRYDGYIEKSDVDYIKDNDTIFNWNPDIIVSYNISSMNISLSTE